MTTVTTDRLFASICALSYGGHPKIHYSYRFYVYRFHIKIVCMLLLWAQSIKEWEQRFVGLESVQCVRWLSYFRILAFKRYVGLVKRVVRLVLLVFNNNYVSILWQNLNFHSFSWIKQIFDQFFKKKSKRMEIKIFETLI